MKGRGMDDLVAFLRTRLDEDGFAAAAASTGPWAAWRGRPGLGLGDLAYAVTFPGQSEGDVAAIATRSWTDAEHIARWDPARVLAEVEAKRQLLQLHAPEPSNYTDGVFTWTDPPSGDLFCEHCASLCHSSSGLACEQPDSPWPCPTVRLLALPYADHPDYREEWRPST